MPLKKVGHHHHPTVTIRLAGAHTATTEIYRQAIRIYIPSAIITIANASAASSIRKVWKDAEAAITKIFPLDVRTSGYTRKQGSRVLASVRFSGRVAGRDIQGKIPKHSPSGCGELRIRLGDLVIVCDDGDAARTQVAIWNQAHELAHQAWPGRVSR